MGGSQRGTAGKRIGWREALKLWASMPSAGFGRACVKTRNASSADGMWTNLPPGALVLSTLGNEIAGLFVIAYADHPRF